MNKFAVAIGLWAVLIAGSASAQAASDPAAGHSNQAGGRPSDETQEYKLGPGDQVRIITYDETQLTGPFSVDASGNISLPLIGEIVASGLTASQLQDSIVARLRDGFINSPSVSVEVMTFRPFYILGEVNKPGEYPYTANLTVLDAVATAGGFTYRANTKWAFIKYPGEATEHKVLVSPTTAVRAGDTVRISERYF